MHVYDYAINLLPDLRVEPSETDPSKTANKFRFRKFSPQNLHKNECRKNKIIYDKINIYLTKSSFNHSKDDQESSGNKL